VAVTGFLIAAAIFGLPYATGYGTLRVSLFGYTANLWKLDEWQHCWLVLPICVFLIWRQRAELSRLPLRGSSFGFLVTLVGLFLYWAGYRVDNYFIGIGSTFVVLAGAIIWVGGWRWMGALAFPWAFLMFAMPLLFLESILAFRLRLIMSDASVTLLNGIGIDTVQQGTAILSAPNSLLGLPRGAGFSVDVADPCSGIRSLFALTMVTALYSYFAIKPLWKQWSLFACAIPLAVIGNMARIMMLTLGTIAVGPEIAIGSLEDPSLFHLVAGYVVFVVALAGMIGVGHLLTIDWPRTISSIRARYGGLFASSPEKTRLAMAGGNATELNVEDEY
jgi:exosortase